MLQRENPNFVNVEIIYRLDDVEDGSPLRRSHPATHAVFGVAQTVNAATYQTVDVIARLMVEGNPCMVEELISKSPLALQTVAR